jgi:transcriptional regulator with XRE-family HTH domain
MMNKIRIGECIFRYRKERGMTQGEFGKQLGVSAFAVSKWEREICYPDIFLLPDISNILGISIDEMMGAQCCKGKR